MTKTESTQPRFRPSSITLYVDLEVIGLLYLEKCGYAFRDTVALSGDKEVPDRVCGLVLGATLLAVGVLRSGCRLLAPVFSVVLTIKKSIKHYISSLNRLNNQGDQRLDQTAVRQMLQPNRAVWEILV